MYSKLTTGIYVLIEESVQILRSSGTDIGVVQTDFPTSLLYIVSFWGACTDSKFMRALLLKK